MFAYTVNKIRKIRLFVLDKNAVLLFKVDKVGKWFVYSRGQKYWERHTFCVCKACWAKRGLFAYIENVRPKKA